MELSFNNILIVDNSGEYRHLLSKLLHYINDKYNIIDVNSGEECLQLVNQNMLKQQQLGNCQDATVAVYDVIIIDNVMSGLTGPQTVSNLRNPPSENSSVVLPYDGLIIGMTGLSDEEDIQKFINVGVDVVLVKPMNTSMLINILQPLQRND